MDVEVALAETVRDWARANCPGEPSVAAGAVAMALNSYAGGASTAEACVEARAFVVSWTAPPCPPRVSVGLPTPAGVVSSPGLGLQKKGRQMETDKRSHA